MLDLHNLAQQISEKRNMMLQKEKEIEENIQEVFNF